MNTNSDIAYQDHTAAPASPDEESDAEALDGAFTEDELRIMTSGVDPGLLALLGLC